MSSRYQPAPTPSTSFGFHESYFLNDVINRKIRKTDKSNWNYPQIPTKRTVLTIHQKVEIIRFKERNPTVPNSQGKFMNNFSDFFNCSKNFVKINKINYLR